MIRHNYINLRFMSFPPCNAADDVKEGISFDTNSVIKIAISFSCACQENKNLCNVFVIPKGLQ